MVCGAPDKPLRCVQENIESTVTVSMRLENRLALGWSSNATLAVVMRAPKRVKVPKFRVVGS